MFPANDNSIRHAISAKCFAWIKAIPRTIVLKAVLCITLAASNTSTLRAEDGDATNPIPGLTAGSKPLVVLTGASVNRLKDEASFLFEAAGAPDTMDAILNALDSQVNGLQGLNWDRPAGVMMYMNSVFPPAFEFVAFLPVSNEADFQSMMELGTVVMQKDTTEEGRYQLITPRRNIQVRIENDYAFIQLPPMDPDPAFDRELPSPTQLVAGLTNQFDLAVSLDVESIPKGTRDLIYNMLYSTMSTQIQQRDDEPESRYEMRKAWMQADIDGLKLAFDELKRFTIGLDVAQEEAGANIDLLLDVREGSQMLEEIFASSTRPSYFTPLIREETPVSLSWSAVMAERDRERYSNVLEALKGELARGIEEDGDLGTVPDDASPLFHAIDALRETAAEGHLDVFAQFYQDSADKIAIVGVMRVDDGHAIAAGLNDIVARLQGKGEAQNVQMNVMEHAGISFHRALIDNADAGLREILGNEPGVTVGCGPRTIWVCLGGSESFETLTGVIDQLTSAYENPVDREVPASLRLVLQTSNLIDLVQSAEAANREERGRPEEENTARRGDSREASEIPLTQAENRRQRFRARRQQNRELMREALAEGDDRIQIEFRPTDSGMRIRAHFDVGYVRGVGRVIASRFAGDE